MQRLYCKAKALGYTLFLQELKEARNLYFNTIKLVKKEHQNSFLEKEDSQTIFKALSYTKSRDNSSLIPSLASTTSTTSELELSFYKKCNIFREALFSSLLTALAKFNKLGYSSNKDQKQPLLSKVELANFCNLKIKSKTLGPDFITQEIIVKAYKAILNIFYIVYLILIN